MLAQEPVLASTEEAGVSALLLALYHGHAEVMAAIREHRRELSVWEAAATGSTEELARSIEADPTLVDAFAPDGFTPLGLAAFFHRPEAVAWLIDHGADVDAASRNDFRVAPLHSAVAGRGHAAIARRLVEVGADVNVRQRHGWTPLHGAVHMGDADLVRLLLARGGDPRAATDDGQTALDMAKALGRHQIAKILSTDEANDDLNQGRLERA